MKNYFKFYIENLYAFSMGVIMAVPLSAFVISCKPQVEPVKVYTELRIGFALLQESIPFGGRQTSEASEFVHVLDPAIQMELSVTTPTTGTDVYLGTYAEITALSFQLVIGESADFVLLVAGGGGTLASAIGLVIEGSTLGHIIAGGEVVIIAGSTEQALLLIDKESFAGDLADPPTVQLWESGAWGISRGLPESSLFWYRYAGRFEFMDGIKVETYAGDYIVMDLVAQTIYMFKFGGGVSIDLTFPSFTEAEVIIL